MLVPFSSLGFRLTIRFWWSKILSTNWYFNSNSDGFMKYINQSSMGILHELDFSQIILVKFNKTHELKFSSHSYCLLILNRFILHNFCFQKISCSWEVYSVQFCIHSFSFFVENTIECTIWSIRKMFTRIHKNIEQCTAAAIFMRQQWWSCRNTCHS